MVIKRLRVRFDPLSFCVFDESLALVPAPDDRFGEPIKFDPLVVDTEWLLVVPCWRGRNGECGRRQPFDHVGVDKVVFGVGERYGFFKETLPAFCGDDFVNVPAKDDAD